MQVQCRITESPNKIQLNFIGFMVRILDTKSAWCRRGWFVAQVLCSNADGSLGVCGPRFGNCLVMETVMSSIHLILVYDVYGPYMAPFFVDPGFISFPALRPCPFVNSQRSILSDCARFDSMPGPVEPVVRLDVRSHQYKDISRRPCLTLGRSPGRIGRIGDGI